ncbi:MAG: DUF4923 family protein [Bacteroidaceae bacterium]|nr:DUF4923 family protein [Bacteroidaceae bacterium]
MKRIFLILAIFTFTMSASAQWTNFLGNALGKLTSSSTTTDDDKSQATNALKNVLGSLIGNSIPVSEATLLGDWNYQGVSCVLESDQALANIGGSVAAGTIEEKLDGYLAKVGVVPGACTFTFLDNDSCRFAVNGRAINGTYKLNSQDKTVAFNFYGRLSMTAHVSYDLANMNLVFDADKLLTLIKKVTSTVASSGSSSGFFSSLFGGGASSSSATASTLSTVSSLLDNYTGMMLGLKLKK